jgi:hypothetical protein
MVSGNREKEPNMTTDIDEVEALQIQLAVDGTERAFQALTQAVSELDVEGVNFWADSLKFWIACQVNPKEAANLPL